MFIDKGQFSVVLPGCCEKSIKSAIPYLELRNDEPQWRCPNQHYEIIFSLNDGNIIDYYNSEFSVKFCPFCGTKTPDVVKVNRDGFNIHKDKDGGYYCNTCDKRNNECECYPEVILFEVKTK